jgi:site-specific recombinase XerD
MQLNASPNTVASYRDTFRLLLKYAADRLGRAPTALQIADIDADLVGDFLTFVETRRGNGARSRNTRLSAIRSFFKYVAPNEPQLLHHCQQVWRCPRSGTRNGLSTISPSAEIQALVAAADPTTRSGRRDRMLLLHALQTGLRVSELILGLESATAPTASRCSWAIVAIGSAAMRSSASSASTSTWPPRHARRSRANA